MESYPHIGALKSFYQTWVYLPTGARMSARVLARDVDDAALGSPMWGVTTYFRDPSEGYLR